MKKVSIAVTLLLLLVSTSAFAQVTASLSGTVSDSSGVDPRSGGHRQEHQNWNYGYECNE